jgi:hypothetical protein
MNSNTLLIAVFKPTLRKKFEFSEIHSVTFIANSIDDTLNMSGIGIKKNEFAVSNKSMNTLKLSENSEFTDLFLNKIKDKLNYKIINVAEIKIDFNLKKCITTLYYLNQNDVKCKKAIELDF